MPYMIANVVKLRWTDRKGASQMRQGNAFILAKRLERLRCNATLELLDGTIIGGCERTSGSQDNKRLQWAWWYEKDALLSHQEPTRQEVARERLNALEAARENL